MRGGGTVPLSAARGGTGAGTAVPKMSTGRSVLVTFLWIACWIPLFPQGLSPLWMIINDSDTRLWFAALHLPDPWRILVAVVFTLLGVAMLGIGTIIEMRHDRRYRHSPPPVEPAGTGGERVLQDVSR